MAAQVFGAEQSSDETKKGNQPMFEAVLEHCVTRIVLQRILKKHHQTSLGYNCTSCRKQECRYNLSLDGEQWRACFLSWKYTDLTTITLLTNVAISVSVQFKISIILHYSYKWQINILLSMPHFVLVSNNTTVSWEKHIFPDFQFNINVKMCSSLKRKRIFPLNLRA